MNWQPICSAPRDGSWIVVCDARAPDRHPAVVRWDPVCGSWRTAQKMRIGADEFTQWQPVDELPAYEPAEEAEDLPVHH